MGFLKGSQIFHQNCEQNKPYIFKNTAIEMFATGFMQTAESL